MSVYKACEIPDDLHYDVERDVWVRWVADGTVQMGMTDPAQARLGKLVNIRFKAMGRTLQRGQSVAILESAKWVGPFPTPLTGVLVAVNEAFHTDILLANKDPYGRGWLARLQPTRLEDERGYLLAGPAAINALQQRIDALGIHCIRCAE